MESLTGHLLIAGPNLYDPNFARTVILVGGHSRQGALGVVLNRPSETTVGEAVPDLADLLAETGDAIHVGGPVQPTAVLILAEYERAHDAAAQMVTSAVGFLSLELGEGPSTNGLLRARIRRLYGLGTRATRDRA